MQQYTHENVRSIPHLPIYCDRYEDYRQFSPRHWHDHLSVNKINTNSISRKKSISGEAIFGRTYSNTTEKKKITAHV